MRGTPEATPESKICTPKRDDEHPRLFHMGVSPRELKTNNLIFKAQIIGLNPVFKFEKKTYRFIKTYSQIFALNRVMNVIPKN